jgi:hypothetical protein
VASGTYVLQRERILTVAIGDVNISLCPGVWISVREMIYKPRTS